MDELAQEAISQALKGNWQKALEINQEILSKDSENIDALNRLARCLAELGRIKEAKATALKVLKIDPFNSIATKSLEKWKKLKKGEIYNSKPTKPDVFLEEPGKTKVVTLIHVGNPKILAKLDSGDEVKLNTHSHRICVTTMDGNLVGKLPDDLSAKLKRLISLGNAYQVFIKSISGRTVKVFIREVKRSPRLSHTPSFPPEKIEYVSFTPPELVHKKEEIVKEIVEEESEEVI